MIKTLRSLFLNHELTTSERYIMQLLLDTIATLKPVTDACRVFHGRGGLFPGCEHLALDWFAPVWLLTAFTPLDEVDLAQLQQALLQRCQALNIACHLVYQFRAGPQSETRVLCGSVPDPHVVTEHGCRYQVHLLRGQNHGLFLDMANGRDWVQQHARGRRVLNLFAYTCGFSVAALSGGAEQVVNVDMSKGALAIGQTNHQINQLSGGARFLGHDIFKSWGKLRKLGPYDLVIVDPPSNQKGSFVASKDYLRLLRHLPELLAADAELLLCLNAPELDQAFLQQQVAEAAPQLRLVQQLANPDSFADSAPERALKVLLYRLDAVTHSH